MCVWAGVGKLPIYSNFKDFGVVVLGQKQTQAVRRTAEKRVLIVD